MSDAPAAKGAAQLASTEFSWEQAVGGVRGLIESIAPGTVFVTAYLIFGGFRVPVIAAVATVMVLVAVRLIQHTPATQALGGLFGVALGAIWAWRAGDASEYFAPGLWITGAYTAALIVTMLVRWPVVGVAFALFKGWSSAWRKDKALMKRFQLATGVFAASQAIKLAIQLPLYLAGATAALGTARLALGAPLFALVLFVMWRMVRSATLVEAPKDQPQPKE